MFDTRYLQEEADICIVGAGAAGGVLAKELAEAGMRVVVIEAGPFRDPQKHFASDELAMETLSWEETRIVDGGDPLRLGSNNCGKGVGGGTQHWTAVCLRFHPSDFRTYSEDGVGVDWPLAYEDLEPYYARHERELAVSGPKHFPWGAFHGPYPWPERNPLSSNAEIFQMGCQKLGIDWCVTPLVILTGPFEGRAPCTNRGFCNQGCMPNAKFSTLIVHIPKAIQAGAVVYADATVVEIEMGKDGKAKGVVFVHDGMTYRQKAKIVILSAFVVENPRLLLHSANAQFPNGLANSSGWVGKGIMVHSSDDVYAKFPEEIRFYKGSPVMASTQAFYETNPNRGFVRGYTLHAHGSRPMSMAKGIATTAGIWGRQLRELMLNYNFYGRVTVVGEVLPAPWNRVALHAEETDAHGVPKAHVTFTYGDNDKRLLEHAVKKAEEILAAAGGKPVVRTHDTAHLMGGCRMGKDPATSVVNRDCQTHDIPNLFICDASVFPTSGGGNPTHTVMAIAARTADAIKTKTVRREI
ncbi:GMC family oxidoreductase [Fodinisporobacter ferrooxydans]|uniref:GMC family oxidoreductase n=1 Tax=Fodinisporobacter ferrooxydans TaxID=2901836 RepID=A0ABY4CTC6_9BACL|nr:GMC family oxidoreductase [Alicyclobacillaceae bacterium MYW30-H2]